MVRDRTPRFGRVITAMVTPFGRQLELDVDAAVALARWLADHGSDGLVLGGTTGEGPVLTDGERLELWRAVSEAVTIPVIAGTGSNDTRHSVELTAAAERAGVAGVLVVTPYYSRPSQAGILSHFMAVAGATRLPVVLYDIPVRTGRRISAEVVLRLAGEAPNVTGMKDAAGDVVGSARLLARAPAGFELYSGDDGLILPLLAVGAVGAICVASHWAGREMGEMIAAFFDGDVARARRVNAGLLESFDFSSTEDFPNPLPAKAACRAQGLAVGQCRPPMGAAPAALDARASELLGSLRPATRAGAAVG